MSKELSSRVFVNNASAHKNSGSSHTHSPGGKDSQDLQNQQQPRPAFSFQPQAIGGATGTQPLNLVEQIPMMGDINVQPPFTSQQRTRDEIEHSIMSGDGQLSSSRLTLQNEVPPLSEGVRKVRGIGAQYPSQMVMSVPLTAINQTTGDEMGSGDRVSGASSGFGVPGSQQAKKHSGTSNMKKNQGSNRKQTTTEAQVIAAPMHYRQGRKLSKQDFIQMEQQAMDIVQNLEESASSFVPVKDHRGDRITTSNQQNQSYNNSSCQRSSQQFSNNNRAVMDQHRLPGNPQTLPLEEQVVMESSHGRRRVIGQPGEQNSRLQEGRDNMGPPEGAFGDDHDTNVYYEEEDEGTYEQNVYGNPAGSAQNDNEVLMTVTSHKKGKHRVLMSSGKKKDPASGGKSIQHNTVYGISFKDKGRPQLISSTEFEKSVAAESDMTVVEHPQNHHPSQYPTGPAVRHPKKGGVVNNNFLVDGGWQNRQNSNRTPTDQQEMMAAGIQARQYAPGSALPMEAFGAEPSPYTNHIPVVLQTANQVKRPSESQQRMRSYRVNSAIQQEERDAQSRKLNAGMLQINSQASGGGEPKKLPNNPQQKEQPQQQQFVQGSSRQAKKRALATFYGGNNANNSLDAQSPGVVPQQDNSFYAAQQYQQQNLHRESTETTRSSAPMQNFLQQSNQFKGGQQQEQQDPPGSKQFQRNTAKRNKREKQAAQAQGSGGWTTNSSQLARANKNNKPTTEYSPENTQHNMSHSTAATVGSGMNPNQDMTGGHGTFQITVSKKQQVQQFLTKEVKPEQTSLWVYNFNDYGQQNQGASAGQRDPVAKQRPDSKSFQGQQGHFLSKQEIRYFHPQNPQVQNNTSGPGGQAQSLANAAQQNQDSRGLVTGGRFGRIVLGDRVPSRQSLTRGSRRGTRGSALDPNGSMDERQPQPGISTDPNEFGGPVVPHIPASNVPAHMFRRPQQTQAPIVVQQNRLGSPFTDIQKRQKVILPSLANQQPNISQSASGQRGSSRGGQKPQQPQQPNPPTPQIQSSFKGPQGGNSPQSTANNIQYVGARNRQQAVLENPVYQSGLQHPINKNNNQAQQQQLQQQQPSEQKQKPASRSGGSRGQQQVLVEPGQPTRHQGHGSSQSQRRQQAAAQNTQSNGTGRSGGGSGSAGGARGSGNLSRSPMRKTSFGVIMEMIKEEEF